MKCKKCGEELPIDSNFCEKCGTKVTEEDRSLAIDVSDLGPDELDDLMPKKNHTLLICFFLFLVGIAGGLFLYFNLTKEKTKEAAEKKNNNQEIIDEYAMTIEEVASEYLLDHELINDFADIKDLVKYDKHDVSCDNIVINIDGTVYLSKCQIDGVQVEEVYGRRKSILTKDDACNIIHNQDENELEFYVDQELISVYECEHDKCGLYELTNYNSCTDMIAVIEDGNTKYLYNYQAAQNVVEPLTEIMPVKDKNDELLGFIAQQEDDEKYGYIDKRGTAKIDFKYERLGLSDGQKWYERGLDLTNNKVVAKLDDKYGVLSLNDGKEIMNFKYDNVFLGPNDYYVVREGKSYYLIDQTGAKKLAKGYNMIFAFTDVLVVNDQDKLYFIDYSGNKLIEDTIDVYVDYKEEPVGDIFGYNAIKDANHILIDVNKNSNDGYDTEKYIYDIDTKKLEKNNV